MKILTNKTIGTFLEKLSAEHLSVAKKGEKVDMGLHFVNWLKETEQISPNDAIRFRNELYKKKKEFTYKEAPKLPFPIRYVGFSLAALSFLLVAGGIYMRFFRTVKTPLAYSTAPVQAGRTISFQGRLTDTLGNPINAPIDIIYNFYTAPTGGSPITGSTKVCTAGPDQDGVFNSLIGNDTGPSCNTELPNSIFTENQTVYLGVTVGSEPSEMTPRQQIANVGYAINSETLQGMPPGQSVSNIPFINQSGDMLIAASNPGLRSTYASANFTISSAQAATIQSAGSGDITLSASEGGALRFKTYGGTLGERMTVLGSGRVGIGTTAPRALFDVNGDATVSGSLIAGGQVKIGEFSVAPVNVGNGSTYYDSTTNKIYYWNGVAWTEMGSGGPGGTQYWQQTLGSLTPTNITDDINIGNIATASAFVHLPGTNNTDAWFNLGTGKLGIGDTTPTSLFTVGSGDLFQVDGAGDMIKIKNVTYSWPASQGGVNSILKNDGSGILTWGNAISDSPWAEGAGILFPRNSTLDAFIGGQSTSSAKFAFLNVNNGMPTASISAGITGGMFLTANGHISTTDGQSLTIGNSIAYNTTGNVLLNPNGIGYVGIGTTAPTAKLDVAGDASLSGHLVMAGATPNYIHLLNSTDFRISTSPGGEAGNTDRFTLLKNGNVGIGTMGPASRLVVNGGISDAAKLVVTGDDGTGNSGGILVEYNEDQSASRTRAQLGISAYNGYLSLIDAANVQKVGIIATGDSYFNGGNVGIGTASPGSALDIKGTMRLSGATSGFVGFTAAAAAGSTTYTLPTGDGTGASLLETNGAGTLSWRPTSDIGYWAQQNGALFPQNSTVDAFIGGTASASAKFAFLNVNSGTPIASISGTIVNSSLFLDGNGNISTTNGQNLVLGNSSTYSTTGPILLNPNGMNNVGIGTTNPEYKLDIAGNTRITGGTTPTLYFGDSITAVTDFYLMPLSSGANVGVNIKSKGTGQFALNYNNASTGAFAWYGGGTSPTFSVSNVGLGYFADKVGVGTTAPAGKLEVTGKVTGKALAMFNETGNQAILTASASGSTKFIITHAGDVGIGVMVPSARLDVSGGSIIGNAFCGNSGTCGLGANPSDRWVTPNGTSRLAQLELMQYLDGVDPSNDLGYIAFKKSSDTMLVASISADMNGAIVLDNALLDSGPINTDVCVGNRSWCDGKIDAGTIDPPYTINGKKYATYLSAMTGVKEETTGAFNTTTRQSDGSYAYTVDFSAQPDASDLWLFSKVTSLKVNIDKMTVLLTPSDNTRTWYKVNKDTFSLTVYSSRPTTISYRLTAPRFDYEKWKNANPFGSGGFVLNDPDIAPLVALNQSGSIPQDTYHIATSASNDIRVTNDKTGEIIEEIATYARATIGSIQTGYVDAQHIVVRGVISAVDIAAQNISSYTLRATRIFVSDAIVSPVIETTDLIATGTATLNEIATNTIRPQENMITIDLNSSKSNTTNTSETEGSLASLIIKGLANRTVASIDAAGNATFAGTLTAESSTISGTLVANQLMGNEATISGTLVAKNIQSENISSIESHVASLGSTLATSNQQFATNINSVQQELALLKNTPLSNPAYYQNLTATDSSFLTAAFPGSPNIANLTVSGNSNLFNVTVANSLMVGSLFVENNSILSLASDLKLSSLGTITLFDNAVIIAKNGTITTKGELVAEAGVQTKKLEIVSDGVSVASIDASGSARFSSLAFNQIATSSAVIADSGMRTIDNEVIPAMQTNAEAAGMGAIPVNASEVAIYNNKVTNESLVYLTPTGSTSGYQLTVVKKESCSAGSPNSPCVPYFSVSTGSSIHPEIQFNWLIIN